MKSSLRDDELWFVDEIAALFAPWGLPPSSGRVYGYLMLCAEPVSVDQIAAALVMSRTGAWNAARVLERFGHVNRYGSPGSKRALYAASDNFAVPFLEQTFHFQIFDADVYDMPNIPSDVRWPNVLIISLSALLLTGAATIYPAIRASRTAPAEALRYE